MLYRVTTPQSDHSGANAGWNGDSVQVAFTNAALAQACITRRAHKHSPRRVERGANTAHAQTHFLYNYGVGSDLASHTLHHEAMDGWQVCRRRNPYPPL